jgi:hypothetical protein
LHDRWRQTVSEQRTETALIDSRPAWRWSFRTWLKPNMADRLAKRGLSGRHFAEFVLSVLRAGETGCGVSTGMGNAAEIPAGS